MKRPAFRPKGFRKYGEKKARVGDITFHSKREAVHYQELLILQQAGEIIGEIERQVLFRLEVNGKIVTRYKPDFVYTRKDGRRVIDETKGFYTRDWQIRWKLLQAIHGDEFEYVLS